MTPPVDDYCELCDLPLSQCVHGQPPPPPPEKKAPAKQAPGRPTPCEEPRVARDERDQRTAARRTPAAGVPAHILAALQDNGGRAEIEDVMAELARRMEAVLRPADHETVNQGELRWRYAAGWSARRCSTTA